MKMYKLTLKLVKVFRLEEVKDMINEILRELKLFLVTLLEASFWFGIGWAILFYFKLNGF